MEASVIDIGKHKAAIEGCSFSQFIGRLIIRHRAAPIEERKKRDKKQQPVPIEQVQFHDEYDEPAPIHIGD